jgi:uncharacterized repeat protein (TIGR01451 family)
MKRAKVLLTSAAFVLGSFLMPIDNNPLQCQMPDGEFTQRGITQGCDLGVDKQVSVDGGATFTEADNSADAAQTQVGHSVIWQITVTNTSDETLTPYGKVTVSDVLPSGVAFDSYTTSAGAYGSNDWVFSLNQNLPATLTIVSHSTSTGLFKNTATLTAYDPCNDGCLGAGAYSDSNPDNDSNDAWIDPSAPPVVLGLNSSDPQVLALTNTGSSTLPIIAAGLLLTGTLVVASYGRLYRKPKAYHL